jgi:cytochrome b
MPNSNLISVRVWDLPTRLFHWGLAGLVMASIVSAKVGGDAMVWHFWFGYGVLALLMFRLIWGVLGGRWSRFTSFIYTPKTIWRYLHASDDINAHLNTGHTPLGALSVFALLLVLTVQAGFGLFSDDEISNSGPLTSFVSNDTSALMTYWHQNWGQWLVIFLSILHVAAICFYRLKKKQDLIQPMLTGDKWATKDTLPSVDTHSTRIWALLLFIACAALVATVVNWGQQ